MAAISDPRDGREERERDRIAWNLPTPQATEVYLPPEEAWPSPDATLEGEKPPELDPAA